MKQDGFGSLWMSSRHCGENGLMQDKDGKHQPEMGCKLVQATVGWEDEIFVSPIVA